MHGEIGDPHIVIAYITPSILKKSQANIMVKLHFDLPKFLFIFYFPKQFLSFTHKLELEYSMT